MNQENNRKYTSYLEEGINDGAKLPEAYALAKLVEDAITNKTYKLRNDPTIRTFDIIVTFTVDPTFGLYFEDNGDGESVMAVSTPNGVVVNYL